LQDFEAGRYERGDLVEGGVDLLAVGDAHVGWMMRLALPYFALGES
jgi:hypothetical protein